MSHLGIVALVLMILLGGRSGAPQRGGLSAAAPQSSFAIYLIRGERLAPVRRSVPNTPAPGRAAMAALLRGPTAAERLAGYMSDIPSRTPLRGVSLSNGTLTVDLGSRFQAGGGSQSMLLRVAQIVYTATQFPSVSHVAFRLDGKPVTAIGGEGVVVSPPVNRSSFEAQAPAILVEHPLPGDQVSTPLSVSGTADVFKAQFSVDVESAAGKLLVHREVEASAGSGVRGGFGLRILLPISAEHLVVVAYDRSPRNGARINVVRIPITVRRHGSTRDAVATGVASTARIVTGAALT